MTLPVPGNLLPPYLRQSNKVIYADGDIHGSLQWLNFCQICKKMRDRKGMTSDIEAQRCSTCSETFTVAENNEKEKGCPVCFECPCCGQALLIRSAVLPPSGPPKEPEEKVIQEKRFHLICQTCRWSSRDAGIPDAVRLPSISSPWRIKPESTNEARDEITALSDYYRAQSIADRPTVPAKPSQKGKRHTRGPGLSSLAGDKYKLVSVAQKQINRSQGIPPPADMVVLTARLPKVEFIEEAKEMEEEELLRYGQVEVAEKRLTLPQRLLFPGEQPIESGKLYPRNKALTSKIVWRCRSCQHVMVKMEYAGQSVKFKLISAAPLLVPAVQPCKPKLKVGVLNDFVVVISNPLSHDVRMTFSLPPVDDSIPAWIDGNLAGNLKFPTGTVILLNRLCAADEKGGAGADSLVGENSSFIAFRKLYTVGLRFSCVPTTDAVDTWISFNIHYDFQETQATVFSAEKSVPTDGSGDGSAVKEPPTTWITLRVDMNLGQADA